MIVSVDPRTGGATRLEFAETSMAELEALVAGAMRSVPWLESLGRGGRARLLEAVADSLESCRTDLVHVAEGETGLDAARLNAELSRSAFQFRLFAQAVREGSYVEAVIDHAGETPLGAAPDVRRMLVPIGPVAVFGASNFPFAFSVAGGDTAAALAAGCPVVLKAHDSHPMTSLRSAEAIRAAVTSAGGSGEVIGLVFGQEAGAALVAHESMRAVSFTGSLATARALLGIVNSRQTPIPFFGELGSLNPVVVSRGAARARGELVAEGLFAAVTGSGGQLCTKPGIAFVPTGADGDALVKALSQLIAGDRGHLLLNRRIYEAFEAISTRLVAAGAVIESAGTTAGHETGFVAAAQLLTAPAADLTADLTEECFGPLVVLVRYDSVEELVGALRRVPPSLSAAIHAEDSEPELVALLTAALRRGVGRIVYNGFPTGVRVSWAQHHGGPWPSTNTQHTSVGVSAIRRFLRPWAWQDAPVAVLPPELRDDPVEIPRRVDGRLILPSEGTHR